jgi:hypothetical protein
LEDVQIPETYLVLFLFFPAKSSKIHISPVVPRLQEAFTSFRKNLQAAAQNVSATSVARQVAKAQLQRQRQWTKATRLSEGTGFKNTTRHNYLII